MGKQETQNDDIYHNIKEGEQKYAYANVNSNTVSEETQREDANELIVIYAKSEYGGRPYEGNSNDPSPSTDYAYACSSETTDQLFDDNYAYATSDSVGMPQRANKTEANNENEG